MFIRSGLTLAILGLFGVVALAQPPAGINSNFQARNGAPVVGANPPAANGGIAPTTNSGIGTSAPANTGLGPAPIGSNPIGSNPIGTNPVVNPNSPIGNNLQPSPAVINGLNNGGLNNGGAPLTNAAGARPLEPTLAPNGAARAPIRATVTKGTGTLPNDQDQLWREYDIRPYTSKVTTTNKPEQAIVDWILRDTGTEAWFSDTLSLMRADKDKLRVYHTAEMQA